MSKFPVDAPLRKVARTFELLGFMIAGEGNHISMVPENQDSTRTFLTIPDHARIKGSTLRTIPLQTGIPREDFLSRYEAKSISDARIAAGMDSRPAGS